MNKFDELNYYEVLEIPTDASPFEIMRAYKNALENYSEDSLLTYSLFTASERVRILRKVNDAYNTLIDRAKRITYDASLSDQATTAASQQNHDCFPFFPNRPYEADCIDARDDRSPTLAIQSETCLTSQPITVERRTGKSSITSVRLSKRDRDRRSVDNKDIGVTRRFRGQLTFRGLVIISLVALLLIALSAL